MHDGSRMEAALALANTGDRRSGAACCPQQSGGDQGRLEGGWAGLAVQGSDQFLGGHGDHAEAADH